MTQLISLENFLQFSLVLLEHHQPFAQGSQMIKKEFMKELYQKGIGAGKTLEEDASRLMAQKYPEMDVLEPSQIKSFWSRLTKKLKTQGLVSQGSVSQSAHDSTIQLQNSFQTTSSNSPQNSSQSTQNSKGTRKNKCRKCRVFFERT